LQIEERGMKKKYIFLYPRSTGGGVYCFTSVLPSVPRYFSSHFSQQLLMAEIWYFVTIFILVRNIVGSVFGPVRFLLPVCRLSWFLYTLNIHLYMHIFRHIFLGNYWWQKSDIWSQASYKNPILWEAFLDPSDSYFLFADLLVFYTHWTYMGGGYHKWALAHSSSCFIRSCIFWSFIGTYIG
jgi:hypothetical protein